MSTKIATVEKRATEIVVKVPCKVILTGEQAVVHGSPAIALSIEPFNYVYLTRAPGSGIVLRQNGKEIVLNEKGEVEKRDELTWAGWVDFFRYITSRGVIVSSSKEKLLLEIKSTAPKGVGASSSIAAALTIALFKRVGKILSSEELFECVQFVDTIAHGGSPSGIDAFTVINGPTQLTRVVENGTLKWNFEKCNVVLPHSSTLVIVDSSKEGKRAGTGEAVKKFATTMGFIRGDGSIKSMTEFTAADREKLIPFRKVFDKIVAQLKENGDPVVLGKAMNENHKLLAAQGVSTDNIEMCREIVLQNGAYGAKITGAGGEGGAVIALINKSDAVKIIKELEKHGFKAFEAKTTKGALQ